MRGEPQGNSDPPGEAVLDDSESDAPDMESARWEDIDPSFSTVLHSLRRAIAKARLRATWLLAAFIVGTLVTLVVIRTRKAVHVAQVTFRVKDDGNASLSATDAELRQMLSLNYFTLPALLAIVEKHNLYERRRARAGYLAVESFREDIRVEATRYENQEEGPTGERLALRVKITFTHADGAVSKAVAGDLADLVVTGSRATLAARHQIVSKPKVWLTRPFVPRSPLGMSPLASEPAMTTARTGPRHAPSGSRTSWRRRFTIEPRPSCAPPRT